MITAGDFRDIVNALGVQAVQDIDWAEALALPTDADAFAREVIFVICNSGMKNTVASGIFKRCMSAIEDGVSVRRGFGHPGKASAIDGIWRDRRALFSGYLAASDRLAYLESLPWIGSITKYHVAKNFGEDVAKPDVHLQRLADREGCTAQQLCERLAAETGLRVATVDTVLWRACANGVIDSRTGVVAPSAVLAALETEEAHEHH